MYLIIGVGSHSEIIASILEECNIQFKHVSYDGPVETDLPYAGDIDQIDLQDHEFIVAIGDNHERKNLVREVEEKEPNIKWFNAISPKAHIEKNVTLGVGNTICSGSIIATRSVVGSHCILNTNSSVDHHNTIGSFVHIAPSVSLCGHRRGVSPAFLAMQPRALDGGGLGLDEADGLENLPGGTGFDLFLLTVQQGEHFAILLQFLAQGGDQRLNTFGWFVHGSPA